MEDMLWVDLSMSASLEFDNFQCLLFRNYEWHVCIIMGVYIGV